ncbi:adenylate/guanylyl cyclase [uncultured Mediterranean phage]|nr:adenylate/guanylyl cyclase [uncultured Mediterranean phage]
MKKILSHWSIAFVTLIALTYIGLQDPWVKEILRLKSFDYVLQNEEKTPSQAVTIVTIDEEAIEKHGQWPWDRDVLANLILQLRNAETGIIVMPILFSEEDRFGSDDAFCETLTYGTVIAQTGTAQKRTSNPVPRGVAKIGNPLPHLYEWNGMVGPLPKLAECANGVGVINTAPEIDGVVRRVPLLMKIGEEVYPNMAIETIRVAVGDPSYQVKADEAGIIAMRVPAYATINTDTNARVWVRWNKEFKTMSAASEDFTPLAGTTVIVAMTAEGLGGVVATPVGEQYDYVISAQTLQTILDGETIKRYDSLLELLAGLILGIAIILITRFLPYWFIGLSLLGTFGGGIYYFQHMFSTQLVLVDITWALLTFFIVGFHATFNRFILEFKLKQQIKKQFEHYLDPRQVKALQKNPDLLKLGGDRKEMSFLFMDIIGFTPISEYYKNKDDPEGLVVLVNEFLDEMTNIILANGGMVDKFMGDCIMAVYGAPIDMPNHAEMAVKSAIEIEAKTKELKQRYKDRGLPDINVGTGVNTGTAIIGNMGSTTRFDFSVIGDAVNLAARLEATAGRGDYLKYPTIYSSMTMDQLPDIYKSKKIGDIKVKGKKDVIAIYHPII